MKKNSFLEGTIIASLAIIVVKILGALYVIPFYSIIGEEGGTLYCSETRKKRWIRSGMRRRVLRSINGRFSFDTSSVS